MVTWRLRDEWAHLPPNRLVPPLLNMREIVIHHSVTDRANDRQDAENIARAILTDHLGRRNPDGTLQFSDIAYNFLVGPDCVLEGRGLARQGGATGNGWDDRTISVCVIGDYENQTVREPERRALIDCIDTICGNWGRVPLVPHKDHYATACCGKNLIAVLPTIKPGELPMTDDYFTHPLVLSDGQPPTPYPTDVEGWYTFIHRELQLIRESNQAILDELRKR